MKWLKFKIKTITDAEDIIISTLYDLGLEGAQIEDKIPLTAWEKEQMFVDILPDGPEDDGVAYLSFFVTGWYHAFRFRTLYRDQYAESSCPDPAPAPLPRKE